jgi:hypothetical protein
VAPVDATAGSAIMVTGQVQLSCAGCASTVSCELVRTDGGNSVAVSPVYVVQLSPADAVDVAAVSVMDVPAANGAYSYQIRLSASGSDEVQASAAVLNVQVLGRP